MIWNTSFSSLLFSNLSCTCCSRSCSLCKVAKVWWCSTINAISRVLWLILLRLCSLLIFNVAISSSSFIFWNLFSSNTIFWLYLCKRNIITGTSYHKSIMICCSSIIPQLDWFFIQIKILEIVFELLISTKCHQFQLSFTPRVHA